jgi:hypothetical protein
MATCYSEGGDAFRSSKTVPGKTAWFFGNERPSKNAGLFGLLAPFRVDAMIDSVLNLLFRCPHRRLTRPVTPVSKAGIPNGQTYVVCLDCGKQFSYDLQEMRVGRPLASTLDSGVLHPGMPKPRRGNWKLALWAVPVAVLFGSAWKTNKPEKAPPAEAGRPRSAS